MADNKPDGWPRWMWRMVRRPSYRVIGSEDLRDEPAAVRENDDAIKAGYERLRAFEREFTEGIENAKRQTAGGLSLFRN